MPTRELTSAPSMLPLFARAGLGLVPGAARLPFVGGRGRHVPDLELTLSEVPIEPERLASYCRVCGYSYGAHLPPTYPHVLAFPLQLALMTDPTFPFAAIGLVHIANRIVQRRPLRSAERLSLRVWATELEPHPRGRKFSLRSEARAGEELVWEEESAILKRGGGSGSSDRGDSGPERLPGVATWDLPADLGRRYAAVSGDLNPIHVHPLSARLFGFPSAIAHGMWTMARSLAALEDRLPDAFALEAAFRKPIILPARVEFARLDLDGSVRFQVRAAGSDNLHLVGALQPA